MNITKKYTLPALPERTVVRIPLTSKLTTKALLKEIKKNDIPLTAKMTLTTMGSWPKIHRVARFEYPSEHQPVAA